MSISTKLIGMAQKAKRTLKKQLDAASPAAVSPVRRIERVATGERVCAMTFDDGPFALPPSPSQGEKPLTLVLLETLEQYGARGTFDVVGDTGENYPDAAGKEGTAAWGGVKFDHYPDIHKDKLGGAVNCPELVERILAGGHQITNHGYNHIIFGKKPFVYGKREHLSDVKLVEQDLKRLHVFMLERHHYAMTMARPPHYVDKISAGLSSYDAYAALGYQYMAAAFDGAGWLPLASYEAEVEATYRPLEELLKKDPNALCGQIIFQKDGYNMARRTPVADGLGKQLEILQRYGYRVVTVEALLEYSPFADLQDTAAVYPEAKALLDRGYCVAFSDNTVRPLAPMTRGELAMLLYGNAAVQPRIAAILKDSRATVCPDIPVTHPYSGAIKLAMDSNVISAVNGRFCETLPVPGALMTAALSAFFGGACPPCTAEAVTRGELLLEAAKLLRPMGGQPAGKPRAEEQLPDYVRS